MQAGAGTFNKECVKEVCVREKAVCDRVFTLCAFVEGSNKKKKKKIKSLKSEGVGEGWRLKSQRCKDGESHLGQRSSLLCGFGSCQRDLAN